jgi:hypothetical protein
MDHGQHFLMVDFPKAAVYTIKGLALLNLLPLVATKQCFYQIRMLKDLYHPNPRQLDVDSHLPRDIRL